LIRSSSSSYSGYSPPAPAASQLRGTRRELSLDEKTVKAHAELLTQLFLVYRLRPWSANLGARLQHNSD